MKRLLIAAGIVTTSASGTLAHPGEHGFSVSGSLFHLLTEPDHLAVLVAAIAVAAALFYALRRRSV
jgi:hydrogenase/urease accessory protein HupE